MSGIGLVQPTPRIRFTKSLKLKKTLILLNLVTIFTSPFAYMPLARIQAAYVNSCFLNSTIVAADLHRQSSSNYSLSKSHYYRFVLEKSELGDVSMCNYVTYGLVFLQLISIITFWHIIQLWGEMVSVGNGGAMAVLLSITYVMTTLNCCIGYSSLKYGFSETCKSISKIETVNYKLSCKHWRQDIKFDELDDMDVIYYMYQAQAIQFFLIFVEASKVLNCMSMSFVAHYRLSGSAPSSSFLN